jgi:hypothetical protein
MFPKLSLLTLILVLENQSLMKFIKFSTEFLHLILIIWQYGISPGKLLSNEKLSSFFEILTISADENDTVFNDIILWADTVCKSNFFHIETFNEPSFMNKI